MKKNDSFAENTVRLGCIGGGIGAGCGLALLGTCASVGVAKVTNGDIGMWTMIISLAVAVVVVSLVYLLVRKSVELRLLRDRLKEKDSEGHNP